MPVNSPPFLTHEWRQFNRGALELFVSRSRPPISPGEQARRARRRGRPIIRCLWVRAATEWATGVRYAVCTMQWFLHERHEERTEATREEAQPQRERNWKSTCIALLELMGRKVKRLKKSRWRGEVQMGRGAGDASNGERVKGRGREETSEVEEWSASMCVARSSTVYTVLHTARHRQWYLAFRLHSSF